MDPIDAGGQFCDRGQSYATAIFAEGPQQKAAAKKAKAQAASDPRQKVVTPILGSFPFYVTDTSHQNYYKGSKIMLTRFGPKKQSKAYKAYRDAYGHDQHIEKLWGVAAQFVGH